MEIEIKVFWGIVAAMWLVVGLGALLGAENKFAYFCACVVTFLDIIQQKFQTSSHIESISTRADNTRQKMSKKAKERIIKFPHTKFQKGYIPWNKGMKMSEEYRQKLSRIQKSKNNKGRFKKGQNCGEVHKLWRGDDVGYANLHHWVYRHKGKPQMCSFCQVTNETKKITWANKSHSYKRVLDDWMPLCYSCHKKYDLNYKKYEVSSSVNNRKNINKV